MSGVSIARGVVATDGGGSGSGDVVGPSSATDGNTAAFDGITGKLIKDSGVNITSLSTSTSTGIRSLSTGLSTTTSTTTSLSTTVSTDSSRITSLSTGLSTTNSTVSALSTSTSTAVVSLSTAIGGGGGGGTLAPMIVASPVIMVADHTLGASDVAIVIDAPTATLPGITLLLPASPADGRTLFITALNDTATASWTIDANGKSFASDLAWGISGGSITSASNVGQIVLIYSAAENTWYAMSVAL